MLDFISYPIGKFLKLIYDTLAFHNYGMSIIILTIAIKSLLLPLTIKQYSSTSRMTEIQPQLQELQKKYSSDSQKLNQEMMKLYQEKNINPASGCLPVFIQMPILFSLYYVISQPLKYMYGLSSGVIQELNGMIPAGADRMAGLQDLSIINYFAKNPDRLSEAGSLITKDHLLNMHFAGINLGGIPSLDFGRLFSNPPDVQAWLLLLIPLLSVITTYVSIKYSMGKAEKSDNNQAQSSMQKSMALVSPIMTGFISFSVPAGLGLYWIISNLLQILQQMFMNKFIIKKASRVKSLPADELS